MKLEELEKHYFQHIDQHNEKERATSIVAIIFLFCLSVGLILDKLT